MNISTKKLKIVQVIFLLISLSMIPLAYFFILPKEFCFCTMMIAFAVFVVIEFILRNRKIKEYNSKGDKWSKIKRFGLKTSSIWFLFVVVLMLILLLVKEVF